MRCPTRSHAIPSPEDLSHGQSQMANHRTRIDDIVTAVPRPGACSLAQRVIFYRLVPRGQTVGTGIRARQDAERLLSDAVILVEAGRQTSATLCVACSGPPNRSVFCLTTGCSDRNLSKATHHRSLSFQELCQVLPIQGTRVPQKATGTLE